MATAGEGTNTSSYEGGGGAVGKFRKRPFRRHQTTPYDRPPNALRNPTRNGWLSKLVDPASKFISAGAHMFLPSVFRKRLPPPPLPLPPPEANQESRERFQDAVPNDNCTGAQEPAIDNGGTPINSSDGGGISELEQMLKQKTFTRSEIDRLTELLRSRTVDLPAGDEDKRTEANLSKPLSDFERHEEFGSSPMKENRNERDRFPGIISTPAASSRVLEEDVASPAELAKAYMGSRPSKISPSMLGLRSQALLEDAALLKNVPFPPKSSTMSLAPKTATRVGLSENGFITPRSRGRSAIYSMARTPYSRIHPTAAQKVTGSTNYGYGGPPSSSERAWEHDRQFGSKQVALKRRSSVLDDDIGSVGPIRRIRQKPNLLSQGSSFSASGKGVGYDAAQHHISSTQKLLLIDEPKHKCSKTVGENEDNIIPSTSYTPVPSKSSEMATKILQHLENLVPKEKSSESKLGTMREKSPTKLTPSMLRGQALRSLEDVDSPKFLQNAQDSHQLEGSRHTCLPDARDSTSQKQGKVEENGLKKFAVPYDMMTSVVNGDTTVTAKDTAPSVETADSFITKFPSRPSQKKRAFQMSAHEDFLELDDDIYSNGPVSIPLGEGREKLETSVVECKVASTEAITPDKTLALAEVRTLAGSVLNEKTDFETSDWSVVGEKNTGFTFRTSSTPSMTSQTAVLNQSTSAFDKIVPPKEPNALPHSIPPFAFSSSSSVIESSGPKFSSWSDPKPESSHSLANVATGATDAQLKSPESDKNTLKAGGIMGKSETLPSGASTSTSTNSIFSFGAPANNGSLNNGSLASSPSIFSSTAPVPASSNFTDQIFNKSSTHIESSSNTTTMTSTTTNAAAVASNSSLSTSAAAPFLAAPIFKFGPSLAPTPVSTVSTSGAETADLKAKTEKESTFGNSTSSPFGGTSFSMASTGSSIFGYSSSFSSSTANNQSEGPLFGTGSGSLVNSQASPAGSGVATVSQSMPIQFGSSASSPVFGTSGITSFTSSSSLFGSSTPAAKLFGSGTSFGLSSLASSETNSVSSSSGATSNVFTFGLSSSASSSDYNAISSSSGATSISFGSSWQQSAKSPTFASTFNSLSPSTGFPFGSTSVSSTNTAPMVFGSSTGALPGSIFPFTTAPATSSLPSLAQTQPVFGNSTSVFTAASGNSDQMNMEDSMAEDTVQASTPATPVFGQPLISPSPPGFMFGSTAPSPALPFQFGGQQNQATQQNPSPFQASSSLDFSAGGSFSLGSGGGDKSNRKFVRVNKSRSRAKK